MRPGHGKTNDLKHPAGDAAWAEHAVIRHLARTDVDAVVVLLWRTWAETYTSILGETGVERHCRLLHNRRRLRPLARQIENHTALVAEADGRIIAFASAMLSWTGVLEIHEVYVDASFRSSGLGSRLLAALLHRYPGARHVTIEVLAENRGAIALYARLGFRPVGARNDWFVPDVQVLQLTRGQPAGANGSTYGLLTLGSIHARSLLQGLGLKV